MVEPIRGAPREPLRKRLVVGLLAAYGVIATVGPALRALAAPPDARQRSYLRYIEHLAPIRTQLTSRSPRGGHIGIAVAPSAVNLLPDDEHDLAENFDSYALAPWLPTPWHPNKELVVVNSTEPSEPASFAAQHDLLVVSDLGQGVALLRRR